MDFERWKCLMLKFGISTNESVYQELVCCYGENHRYYHDENHIKAVLKHLDVVSDLAKNPHEIEIALWFHDAIYKPFSSTNELDSADWASQFLVNNNIKQGIADRVHKLIMATIHTAKLESADERLIVDIDLSILGSCSDIYDQFEKNVRKEYRLVPFFLYKKKRKEILKSFLDRDRIYQTDYFKERYEQHARLNLDRAVNNL